MPRQLITFILTATIATSCRHQANSNTTTSALTDAEIHDQDRWITSLSTQEGPILFPIQRCLANDSDNYVDVWLAGYDSLMHTVSRGGLFVFDLFVKQGDNPTWTKLDPRFSFSHSGVPTSTDRCENVGIQEACHSIRASGGAITTTTAPDPDVIFHCNYQRYPSPTFQLALAPESEHQVLNTVSDRSDQFKVIEHELNMASQKLRLHQAVQAHGHIPIQACENVSWRKYIVYFTVPRSLARAYLNSIIIYDSDNRRVLETTSDQADGKCPNVKSSEYCAQAAFSKDWFENTCTAMNNSEAEWTVFAEL